MPSLDEKQSDSLAMNIPFPLLERWDSEERYSALQQDWLHLLCDRCIADAIWGKREKKSKGLITTFLSNRMQFKSCFTGDAEGRTSCIIFSKTCDAWVLVQHSRWWLTWGGEAESCIYTGQLDVLLCWFSVALLIVSLSTFIGIHEGKRGSLAVCLLRSSKIL